MMMVGRENTRRKRFVRFFAIVFLLIVLILWQPRFLLIPVQSVFTVAAKPFEVVFSGIAFSAASFRDFVSSIGSLKQENERLAKENKELLAANAEMADIQRENKRLREEWDLLPRGEFSLKAAEVIGRDHQSAGNWVLIDRGSLDGIEVGMSVIVHRSVFAGKVVEVSPLSSRVMLATDPESVLNGVDVNTEARGIVRGQYGLGLRIDTVLQSDTLQQGDFIVTSGLGGDVPRGLLFGTVDTITLSSDGLFQQATIRPAVSARSLETVFVITGPAEK